MKHHALFSSKDKKKKNIVSFAAILLGTLRIKSYSNMNIFAVNRQQYLTKCALCFFSNLIEWFNFILDMGKMCCTQIAQLNTCW